MSKTTQKTKRLVTLALFAAIIVVLANTPLGFIQLPIIKATTIHIPVIIGAILLGPLAGGILGGVFGICSMVNNTIAPKLSSFAFSPFMSTTGVPGALKALWIAVGCRILIGVVSGWVWRALSRTKLPQAVKLPITGFLGSITNTLLVMGSIYFLLGHQYAQEVVNEAYDALFTVIVGIVGANGIPEAAVAAVLVTLVCIPLMKALKRSQ